MTGETGQLRIPGLSKADFLELCEYVDSRSAVAEPEPVSEGDLGDLGLVTGVLLISIPAVRGLIAYLAFRHRGKSFEQTIEYELPDGTRVRKQLKWRDTSGEPVDAALARELGASTGIPVDALLERLS
jgi:hypothetical protein